MATPKKEVVVEEVTIEEEELEPNPLLETARKVLLAGIGVVALSQDAIEDFVGKLVERGEIAEKDGRKLVHEIMDKRKKSTDKAEDQVNKRIEDVLERMNVPSKADIETLGDKIDDLTKKVDALEKP